jgi:hypothetical protein
MLQSAIVVFAVVVVADVEVLGTITTAPSKDATAVSMPTLGKTAVVWVRAFV